MNRRNFLKGAAIFDIFNFALDDADMAAIAALNRNERVNPKNDPDNFPW